MILFGDLIQIVRHMNVEIKKKISVVMFWLKLDLSRILVAEQLTME